jgi:hypothetical protein
MSTPPPVPEWTLTAKHTHGTFGQLLVGCHIKKTLTHYLFTTRHGHELVHSLETKLPTARFTFPDFDYNGLIGVSITMNIPVAAGTNWTGLWSCQDSPLVDTPLPQGPQSGDFTAQAGSGLGEEEVANSAKA